MVNFINFIKKTSFAGHDLFLGPTQQPVLGCLHSRDLYQVKLRSRETIGKPYPGPTHVPNLLLLMPKAIYQCF